MTREELIDIDKMMYERMQSQKKIEQEKLERYFEGYEKGCDDFRKAINSFLIEEEAGQALKERQRM